MGSQFESDLEAATADVTAARGDFVSAVQRLSESELERGRRGGWPVRRVLEHVIQSEQLYAALIGALRGLPVGQVERPSCAGQAATEILCLLDSSRTALLSALDGVGEETFYTIKPLGHEEYSVLSLLENVASHDREHARQIAEILAAS